MKNDEKDATAVWAKNNPTAFAFIPLGNKLIYALTFLTTLHAVAWFIYAFTADGLFKPLSLLIAGVLIVNIAQYAVMLT